MLREDDEDRHPGRPVSFGSGDARLALRRALERLEGAPFDRDAIGSAARAATDLGSDREAELLLRLAADDEDAEALYALGFLLVDGGRPRLATAYLERCLERVPDDSRVAYELGYARFRSGDYAGAEPLLERTLRDETLAGPEPFSAGALLVECHLRRGRRDEARAALLRLERNPGERDEAQLDALAAMLLRAERLFTRTPDVTAFTERDWHFVLNGAAVLHATSGAEPRVGVVSIDFLAAMLRRLEVLLEALGTTPRRVSTPVVAAEPLALALARRLGVPFDEGEGEGALIVLREPRDADGRRERLRRRDDGSLLFALSLDPRLDHALLPDVTGEFAGRLLLPWESRIEVGAAAGVDGRPRVVTADERDVEWLAESLCEAIEALEGDRGDLEILEAYYAPIRELLAATRPDEEPLRRSATSLRSA
jgi:tetratricopeptide (TPR) repeat protein